MSEYAGDWPLSDGRMIRLLTKPELQRLQDVEPDTVLVMITGKEVIARDMDDDDRYGFVAAGFVIVP